MTTFREIIEYANARGVGQLHVFEDGLYQSTWRSLEAAKDVAMRKTRGQVFNDSGDLVFNAQVSS